jgi:hypothetical protein
MHESRLRRRRAELLHVLCLPDFERADRIGEFWGNLKTRTFGEGAPNQPDLFPSGRTRWLT